MSLGERAAKSGAAAATSTAEPPGTAVYRALAEEKEVEVSAMGHGIVGCGRSTVDRMSQK